VANSKMRLSEAISLLAVCLSVVLVHAQEPLPTSDATPRIFSTQYTIRFPLTSTFTVIPPSTATPTSSETMSSASESTNVVTSATSTGGVSPVISVSTLPSLQVATVTDIWWSPVIGQGGPGIPTTIQPRPWGKYDKIVVAHAAVGSVAWLIISPLAIILARLSKSPSASPSTFSAHKWMQSILTVLLTLVAVILGGIATNVDGMPGGGHFQSAHQRMGLVLLLLLVLQILLGRWVSQHGHRGFTSLGSALHIAFGVTLTAIGFAQIYLGFNLYEQRSSRKVPVAVKVIWAIIVGLFSIYLIALALRTQLRSKDERSSPNFSRKRKAAIYGTGPQSPAGTPGADRSMSWEYITGGPSSPGLASARRFSPEMRQTSPLMSAVPIHGQRFSSLPQTPPRASQSSLAQGSPQPFTGLQRFSEVSDSPFSDANAVATPVAAHFSSRQISPPPERGSSLPLSLSLPVIRTAPLVQGPATSAVSLQAIDEEAAVGTGASISGYTASTNESSNRILRQQRARASTGMLPETAAEQRSSGEEEISGSSREDLLNNVPRRGSAPDGRRSVSSIRRKAVPPLLQ